MHVRETRRKRNRQSRVSWEGSLLQMPNNLVYCAYMFVVCMIKKAAQREIKFLPLAPWE